MADPFGTDRRGIGRRKAGSLALVMAVLAVGLMAGSAHAQGDIVTGTTDPDAAAQALAAPGLVNDAIFAPSPYAYTPSPTGIATSPIGQFPTEGDSFTILTSGDAELADDPNDSNSSGVAHGAELNGANDPTVLRVDITVPQGATCLAFDFAFYSEEFPEFIDAGFNDRFIAEISNTGNPGWSVDSSGVINAPNDFAGGEGDVISVDSQGPSGQTAENAAGTTYDGGTPKLIARTPIQPGDNSIYFSIFDIGDFIYDSAVFIDNLRATNETGGQCQSVPVDPAQGTTGVNVEGGEPGSTPSPQFSPDLAGTNVDVTCDIEPDDAPVTCNINLAITLELDVNGEATASATPVQVAFGSASIPNQQTQAVPVVSTDGGKAAMADQQAQSDAEAKKAKKFKKKAKKAKKKAKKKSGKQKKKLKKKAKKLKKKAKKAQQKSSDLRNVNGTLTIGNPDNGAIENIPVNVTLP